MWDVRNVFWQLMIQWCCLLACSVAFEAASTASLGGKKISAACAALNYIIRSLTLSCVVVSLSCFSWHTWRACVCPNIPFTQLSCKPTLKSAGVVQLDPPSLSILLCSLGSPPTLLIHGLCVRVRHRESHRFARVKQHSGSVEDSGRNQVSARRSSHITH